MTPIEPCPYCGSDDCDVDTESHPDFVWVTCGDCWARGPTASEGNKLNRTVTAILFWNKRSEGT